MKEFVQEIASRMGFQRMDLVEKDLRLHTLLRFISTSHLFKGRYLFKGGTCLIKAYMGYYRLSEDIDLTYVEEGLEDLTQKRLRKKLGIQIDELAQVLYDFSIENGYDFKPMKNDERYIQHGGSNKFVTFKLHYNGDVTGLPSLIKVQINFLEEIIFPQHVADLRSLSTELTDSGVRVAFPEDFELYSAPIRMDIYDIEEIFCEKFRAVLTRRGIKARDFVDLYKINNMFGLTPMGCRKEIITKTLFMIERYRKYKENMKEKIDLLDDLEAYNWSYESGMFIERLRDEDIFRYIRTILPALEDISEEVSNRVK